MSADGWMECPICIAQNKKYLDIGRKNMSESEWQKYEILSKALDDNYEPVRLDYEFGVNKNGLGYVYFNAECQICGSTWKLDKDDIQKEVTK